MTRDDPADSPFGRKLLVRDVDRGIAEGAATPALDKRIRTIAADVVAGILDGLAELAPPDLAAVLIEWARRAKGGA